MSYDMKLQAMKNDYIETFRRNESGKRVLANILKEAGVWDPASPQELRAFGLRMMELCGMIEIGPDKGNFAVVKKIIEK